MARWLEQFRGFADWEIQEIVNAGGGLIAGRTPEDLKNELHFLIGGIRGRADKQTPPDLARLSGIADAATVLLKLFELDPDDDPYLQLDVADYLEMQGYFWAPHWHRKLRKSDRISVPRQRRNKRASATKASLQGREVRDLRLAKWHRHGSWPKKLSDAPENGGASGYDLGQGHALVASIEGIQRLRTWAHLASIYDHNRLKTKPTRRPITILIGGLAEIYPKFFGRRFAVIKRSPSLNRGTNEVTGRSIQFVQACLRPLGLNRTGAAIEKAWDTSRADKASMGNSLTRKPK
jgi:hypothetical protein